ncbi:MAG: DUF1214 domain-containing protein [Salaquimonas sp.]
MRLIVNVLVVVAIGLVLGATTAWYSIQRNQGLGGIEAGPWTAWPFAGGSEADPYTMAKVSRDGTIPLGATEGLAFEATTDDQNQLLTRSCDYSVSGITPPSKLWTLAVYDSDGNTIEPSKGSRSALHSGKLLRFPDGSFRVTISKYPQPGNWLSVTGNGDFYFVLRVYDTPVTSTSGQVKPQMPNIIRRDCRQ